MAEKIMSIFSLILCSLSASVFCLFEMCNHKVEMKAGEKLYINSPYYPSQYPIGSSCRYVIKAPQNYKLKFTCTVNLNKPPTAVRCHNDIFFFNPEGSEILTESEYFCGSRKFERKSFLNQAVLSYISTPQYKRMLTTFVKDTKKATAENEMKETEIKIHKQQQQVATKTNSTTKIPTETTSKALKENQLATLIATKAETTIAPIAMANNLSISFTQSFSSKTFSATSLEALEEETKNEDKKVDNSFAYVVTLLSNKMDKVDFATTTSTTSTKPLATTTTTSPRPTSVFNFNEYLSANTWHNGSLATHKISTKRDPPEGNTRSQLTVASSGSHNTRSNEAGGSFSCLAEVMQPQCECGWSSTVKIVGASGVAGINEFPSMAGIMTIKNHKIFCGATIIHHRYLLSAAHCFMTTETQTPEYLTAVVGELDVSSALDSLYTRQYDLVKIIPHEQFQASAVKVHNDIAVLKTRLSIEWNRSVGPACLPFYGRDTIPYAGQRVETAGWGTTSFGGQQSSWLLKTTLDVISRSACENLIGYLPFGEFCTYTPQRDSCQYDSGGALYVREERLYAVGIVSYGYACATKQPSINTRISSYLNWIRSHTPGATYCFK